MLSGWPLIGFLLWPGLACAQPVLPLDPALDRITVETPFLHQLWEPPGGLSTPAGLVTKPGDWLPVTGINYGRRAFVGWARLSVCSPQARLVWLELTTHFMDSVGVWTGLPYAPPQRVRGPSSWREQARRLAPAGHHYFLYALRLPANQPVTVWIRGRVVPGDALKFSVRLWSPAGFLAGQQADVWSWAVFVGIVLAILAGVLVSFVFYRRGIYLLYGGYVFFLSIYALLNDGWGAFLPDSLAWFDSLTTIVHWLNLGVGSFVIFSRRFLGVRPGRGWLRRPALVPMGIIAASVLVAEWGQRQGCGPLIKAMYGLGYAGFAGYIGLWLTYLADAFRRRFRLVWLMVGAVSTLIVFFLVNTLLINSSLLITPLPDMLALRLSLLLELAVLSVGWLYRRKLLQTARRQLEVQNRALQTDIIQTQETEQQRIATDLHDDLGGTLASIRQQLAHLRRTTTDPNTQRAFDDLEPLIQKSSHDLRRIAHNLMPPDFARLGLAASLEQLVGNIPARPTRVEFLVAGPVRPLPTEVELNAYRIVLELVQNVQKHAGASRASVQLLYHADHLTVQVEDNGVGMPARYLANGSDDLANGQGMGLRTSKLRADYIGATLRRETGAGGTFVLLTIPYAPLDDRTATLQSPPRR